MKLYAEKAACCGCGACADICRAGAIHMIQDKEGFLYPNIEDAVCRKCNRCIQVCPIKNQTFQNQVPEMYTKKYFGMHAKENQIRYSSSSGGMFSVLARFVLQRQGKVYGAGYNHHMEVLHMEISDMLQLKGITKSKYVQSNLAGIYCRIEKQLKGGQWVLFSGTPCQTHALKLFLNQVYSRLILVDLVCYGVSPPGIWNSYVRYLEGRYNGKMTEFYFRDKRNRDNGQTCACSIGGKEYVSPLYQNIYCRMYFKNYILRPSCYRCKYCTTERESDFTIGDFWGIERVRPDLNDGMGTSMVIVHTEQAKTIWNAIKDQVNWFVCEKEEIMQPRLYKPTIAPKGRKQIMTLYKVLPFSIFVKLMAGITGRA